jgi:hypothetical protein
MCRYREAKMRTRQVAKLIAVARGFFHCGGQHVAVEDGVTDAEEAIEHGVVL